MAPVRRFRLASAVLLLAAASTVSCRPADEGAVSNNNAGAARPAAEPRSLPLPQPPMDRASLLGLVARAASAAAAGIDDSAAQRPLDGRPFELRIRFGCDGPAEAIGEAALGWSYDSEDRTLRVRALPTLTDAKGLVPEIAGRPVEAVEGFWLERPWLLQPSCPAMTVSEPPPAKTEAVQTEPQPKPHGQRVGIAEFYTAADSRTERRRDRPYQLVTQLDQGASAPVGGFNLVLSGRLSALGGNRVIRCVPRGPDAPPDCIVSARFDRVQIERPQSREILAEWRTG
jgi:hypothetical protein